MVGILGAVSICARWINTQAEICAIGVFQSSCSPCRVCSRVPEELLAVRVEFSSAVQTPHGNWRLASSAQNKAFGRGKRLEEDVEGNAGASQSPKENLSQISVWLLLRPGAALDLNLPFLDRGGWGEAKSTPKEGEGMVTQPPKAEQAKLLGLGCCRRRSTASWFLLLHH